MAEGPPCVGPLFPVRPNQVYYYFSHSVYEKAYSSIIILLIFENRNLLHAIQTFAVLRIIYILFLFVPPSTAVLDVVWSFSKEDVEKCKQKDLLEQTMSEMIGEFPALHQTIVAERDIYLTHTLRQAARCVEAPHNSQSNYCRDFSLHPSRLSFCLCWHWFVIVFVRL